MRTVHAACAVVLAAAGASVELPVAEAARNLEIRVTEAGSPVAGAQVCLGLQANDSGEGSGTSDATGTVRFPNKPAGSRTYYATVTRPGVIGAIRGFQITNNLDGGLDPPQTETVSLPGNAADAACSGPGGGGMPGMEVRISPAEVWRWRYESCLDSFSLGLPKDPELRKLRHQALQSRVLAFCQAAAGRRPQGPLAAAAAFNEAVPVFQHPRCTTCHSPTTVPASPHPTEIQGRPITSSDCATCHNRTNRPASAARAPVPLANSNRPWRMAPATMALTESMAPQAICLQIRSQVPGATFEEQADHVADHVLEDDLVRWAFAPECGTNQMDEGACDPATRPAAPGGHQTFADTLRRWADNGGACP